MSRRRDLVLRYFDGFRHGDHEQILSCLTDDVTWDIVGHTSLRGKAAFDAEIENPAFEGSPRLTVDRLVGDADTVVAVGEGQGSLADGGTLRFAFCTLLTFRGDVIAQVESYVVPIA